MRRLALHASEIKLLHPITRELMSIQAPMPPIFDRFVAALGRASVEETTDKAEVQDSNKREEDVNRALKVISIDDFLGNSTTKKSSVKYASSDVSHLIEDDGHIHLNVKNQRINSKKKLR
jgi:hypothetical protein